MYIGIDRHNFRGGRVLHGKGTVTCGTSSFEIELGRAANMTWLFTTVLYTHQHQCCLRAP